MRIRLSGYLILRQDIETLSKTKNRNTSDGMQRKEFLCNIGRNANEYSIIEDSIGIPQKAKTHKIQQSTASRCMCVCVHMKRNHHNTESMLMFIEILFIIVETWIQPYMHL